MQLGEDGEITVACQEFLYAMCNAQRRNPGVVNDAANNVRTLHEAPEDRAESAGFGDQVTGRSVCPGLELRPSVLAGCGRILPDPSVRDDADELVAAGPRYGPRSISRRQVCKQGVRGVSHADFSTVAVDQYVGVDGYHGVSLVAVDQFS